jgi:hypothetical protein
LPAKEQKMDSVAGPGLRAIGVDVKAVARHRGPGAQHPVLPPQVLALTRHWLALGGKTPPLWSQFEMMDVAELVPHLTILRCNPDDSFLFTFMGARISSVLGEDLCGCIVNLRHPVLAEIDWYRRCRPVADIADVQVHSGMTNPPYTSPLEFIAADFPFMDEGGGAVSHIAGITIARQRVS